MIMAFLHPALRGQSPRPRFTRRIHGGGVLFLILSTPSFALAQSVKGWESVRDEAEELATKQELASAAGAMREAVKLAVRALGANDPQVARMLMQLADYHWSTGQLKEARHALEQALFLWEQRFGAGSAEAVNARYRLGLLSFDMGRIQDAEQLLKQVLAMRQVELDEGHPDVASATLELGMLYDKTKRFEEAGPLLQRAVERLRIYRAEVPKRYARGLMALAWHHHIQGQDPEAVPLCEEALRVDLEAFGPSHAVVATDLSNLAALYQQVDRYEDAERTYVRALTTWEAAAPHDPEVGATWQEYAVLLRRLGKLDEAGKAEQRALPSIETP